MDLDRKRKMAEETEKLMQIREYFNELKDLDDGEQAVLKAKNKFISLMAEKREKTRATIRKNAEEAANMEMKLLNERTSLLIKREKFETALIQAKKENDSLKKSLSAAEFVISKLRKQYDSGHSEAIAEHSKHKRSIKKTKTEYTKLYTEHILLRTAVEKLEKERDEFKVEHMRKVMDLNTQNNRKERMLETKISEMTKALGKISVDSTRKHGGVELSD